MNLELKKFDMTQIKDDKVVVLIGKRDTGKSFLCRDILYHTEIYQWVSYIWNRRCESIIKLFQNYLSMVNLHQKLFKIC